MKTTIDLPDDIFQRVKVLAAERSTTIKDIMVCALNQWMRTPTDDEEKQRKARMKELFKAMQASNTEPMVPLKRSEIHER